MASVDGQFERVAGVVAERTSELLCTAVSIVDDRGMVVASNEPRHLGIHIDLQQRDGAVEYLRVPLHLDSGAGEVIITEPANGEVVAPRLAMVLTELIIDQAAMVDQLPNKHELKNKFIYDVLHGSIGDEVSLFREAQILGMDLSHPRVVILIDASDYILQSGRGDMADLSDAPIRRRAQLIIGDVVDFFQLPNDTICAHIGHGEVAVLKASNRITWIDQAHEPDRANPSWANLAALKQAGSALLTRLRTDTGAAISVGIGRYHPGLTGLGRSYQDARAALTLGRRFHGQNRVHCLNELGVAAFIGIADERTKIDLAHYLLSPLDHEPDLLATVDAFLLHDCCPSTTAAQLCIHRNTLSYRLDKIGHLTGLDPRRFDDAVQMRLALLLRSLADPSGCASAQSSERRGQDVCASA